MKIGLVLPVYINTDEHLYFTKQTIDSIKTEHDYTVIIVENYVSDKYREQMDELYNDKVEKLVSEINSVSNAWNIGIEEFLKRGIETILIPNNDIIFHEKCIDNLVDFTKNDEFVLWTALTHPSMRSLKNAELVDSCDEHPGFSLFAVTKDGLEKLRKHEDGTSEPKPGLFDVSYEMAYFEDSDFHQRVLTAGLKAGKTAMAKYYHFGSRTISVDTDLNNSNYHSYERNRRYFEKKWGYDPHGRGFSNEERLKFGYKTSFNK